MFAQIYAGEYDRLRTDWKTQGRRLSRDQWADRVEHLLANPTPHHEAEFPRAEAITSFWQPAYWSPWLPLLSVVGLLLAICSPPPVRGATVLGLAALSLMLVAAAVNGPVPRYRYPADPLIAVLAAGAAITLANQAVLLVRRLQHPTRNVAGAWTLQSSETQEPRYT